MKLSIKHLPIGKPLKTIGRDRRDVMGCDIHGQVEYFDGEKWRGVKDIGGVIYRSYKAFKILFNVRNYDQGVLFPAPLFGNRGLPDDVDKTFNAYTWGDYPGDDFDVHSHSYFTYAELKDVCWREKHPIRRITTLMQGGVSTRYVEETIVKYGEVLFYEDWRIVFKLMKVLARQHGADNVRCVVWFDN